MTQWYGWSYLPQKTAGIEEPWFHGSQELEPFDRFDPDVRERESTGDPKHWNCHLGSHFTSEHDTAAQIAFGHSGAVYHVGLAAKNPKHYMSEKDLDRAARNWAKDRDYSLGQDSDPANSLRYSTQVREIAHGFREDLKSKGHDGITYGNEYEGSHLHECAIAFHPEDITIHHVHHASEPCEEGTVCQECLYPRTDRDWGDCPHCGHDLDEPGQFSEQLSHHTGARFGPLKVDPAKAEQHQGLLADHLAEHHPDILDKPQAMHDALHRAAHTEEGRGWGNQGEPNLLGLAGHDHHPLLDPSLPLSHRLTGEHPHLLSSLLQHFAMYGETNWDHHYDEMPDEIHRGLFAPQSAHAFGAPASDEDIAHMLIAAHQDEHYPHDDNRDMLFGTHWTTDEDVAKEFAREHEQGHKDGEYDSHYDPDEHYSATPVVFHAEKPALHEIEHDPRRLDWQNVYGHDESSEKEVPIGHGKPMRINGVSWRTHTKDSFIGEHWHRHDLDKPVTLYAEDRDSPEDETHWNSEPPKTSLLQHFAKDEEPDYDLEFRDSLEKFMDLLASDPSNPPGTVKMLNDPEVRGRFMNHIDKTTPHYAPGTFERHIDDQLKGKEGVKDRPDPDPVEYRHSPPRDPYSEGRPSGHHSLNAFLDGTQIGRLSWWDPGDGPYKDNPSFGPKIDKAEVASEHRRRGLGAEMFRRALEITPGIQHSDRLSGDGRSWRDAVSPEEAGTPAHSTTFQHRLGAKDDDAEYQQRVREHAERQAQRKGYSPGDDLSGWDGYPHAEWVPIEVAKRFREHSGVQHAGSEQKVEEIASQLRDGRGMTDPLMLLHHNEEHVASLGEGNHRLTAAERAGWSHVPMRVCRMYDSEVKGARGNPPPRSIPEEWRGTHQGRTPEMCSPSDVLSVGSKSLPQQHTASKEEVCDGTGHLPRAMSREPDGSLVGMCISCMDYHPVTEVIPPSKPEWPKEFRLAPHAPSPPQQHQAAKGQVWYHRGGDPQTFTGDQWVHMGTRTAAGARGEHYPHTGLYRVTVAPQHPANGPEDAAEDFDANRIDQWMHLGSPLDEDGKPHIPRRLLSNSADNRDLTDSIRNTGFKPGHHDALYYRNNVEDEGSISLMAHPSAITHVEPVVEPQHPLFARHAKADHSKGVMVALVPPPKVAEAIEQEDGEDAGSLHITLAFLGDTTDLTKAQLRDLPEVVSAWAETETPLNIGLQGSGTFTPSEEGGQHVLWAAIAAKGINLMHERLVNMLRKHGYSPREDHEFHPHLTLAYSKYDVRFHPKVPRLTWDADEVWVCVAGEWESVSLGSS